LEREEIVPLTEKCKCPAGEHVHKYPLIRIRMYCNHGFYADLSA
jgi:hypothetical protein